MADVQPENGYTRIAHEILEQMARIKLSPTQYRILFVVWRFTYGFKRKSHNMSLKFISEATGCDKRSIQRDLKSLEERKIILQKVKNGSYRSISFNKNHDDWIGKTAIGEITIGETANGETANARVGETANGTIGETANQERNKETSKEKDDDVDKPNPVTEYEKHFGPYPSGSIFDQNLTEWITGERSQFKEPEAIICEVFKRAKLTTPRNPTMYIQKILTNLHNLDLFTLEAVKQHNEKFDRKQSHNSHQNKHQGIYEKDGYFSPPDREWTDEEIKRYQIEVQEDDELPF